MTTINTSHGEFSGRTVESIIRREYGRRAIVKWSADKNSQEIGLVVTPSKYDRNAYNIEAAIYGIY